MHERPLVVVSGGGTGGHLYPALAIADALRRRRPDARVLFIGAQRGIEATLLPEREEEHILLPLHGVDRTRPWTSWRAVTGLATGLLRVFGLYQRERPEVVVVTGGYASAAAGLAAGLMGIPLVVQEQNSHPGATNRLLARWAGRVHVAYPEAIDLLGLPERRVLVSGNPVRGRPEGPKAGARELFDVPGDDPVVIVSGGSQGSLRLNEVMVGLAGALARGEADGLERVRFLWATGRKHFDRVSRELADLDVPATVRVLPYFDEMPTALAAADVAVSRSGAMSVAELMNHGLPAVLVPLPTSAAGHQLFNARSLEAAGAATVVEERELDWSVLAERIAWLLSDESRLDAMRSAARGRAKPNASDDIAADVATFLPGEAA